MCDIGVDGIPEKENIHMKRQHEQEEPCMNDVFHVHDNLWMLEKRVNATVPKKEQKSCPVPSLGVNKA